MEKILLMMDDDFQRLLELKSLLPPEIIILHAYSIRDASILVAQQQLSIVILKLQGAEPTAYFEFLADLRAARAVPILLTHTYSAEQRMRAYYAGADLCIDFPARITEVAAGIHALLRRYYTLNRVEHLREDSMVIRHKELIVDPRRLIVTMRGKPVELLAKEFSILHFLARHPGHIFTREQIYEHVWKEEYPYGSQSVVDHICAIRRKLGLSSQDKEYIETVRHVGYRFVPTVSNRD